MTYLKNNSYIILFFIICVSFTIIGVNKLTKEQTYMEITVSEGDSLWALAHHHNAENRPVNEWIEEVMKLNDLSTATIQIGTELRLPTMHTVNDHHFGNQIAEAVE